MQIPKKPNVHTCCCVFISSSYLSPSGGNYGVISSSRIKRRPSSHFEMEINDCELSDQIQNEPSASIFECLHVLNCIDVFAAHVTEMIGDVGMFSVMKEDVPVQQCGSLTSFNSFWESFGHTRLVSGISLLFYLQDLLTIIIYINLCLCPLRPCALRQ